MFHLTTHAFFKALLFLGAGSVIIALHHEQDIWKMGALRKKMPVTFWTFMAGTLALAGLWPFSGFFSKDSILALAARHNLILFMVGVVVAALTTFYMFRLVFVVFFGARRTGVSPVSDPNSGARVGDESLRQAGSLSYEPHESPGVMVWPLRVLAVFSVIGGIIGVEAVFGRMLSREHGEEAGSVLQQLITPFVHAPVAATLGLLAVAAGFAAAYVLYAKADKDPLPEKLGAFSRAMRNRFYFDELYEATFIRLHDFLAAIAAWIDRWIIAGLGVRGAHGTTEIIGRALRLLQTGNLQMYAFLFALGVALVLWLALGK
jgi:NADH-quinone oxidoreductase subunit L